MDSRLAARPDSQILTEFLDLFPESPTPVQQRFNPPPSPPPRARSHYRPFSTLYNTESSYIELGQKPSRLKRSSSIGTMQALNNMGISLSGRDKSKAKKESSPRLFSSNSARLGDSAKGSRSYKFKSKRMPEEEDRPSSSLRTPRSTHTLRVKKKRSMASLFTSSESSFGSGNNVPESHAGLPRSPLRAHHVISPPPTLGWLDKTNKTYTTPSATNKAVTFQDNTSETDISSIYLPQNIWAKRHNMTLHPYHEDVPYMQAYDPIQLENDRLTDLLLQRLSHGKPSFHDFGKKPPATVLDLGCGQGHWILYASSIWRQSQFTGFDVVDITLPTFRSANNAGFKQGNFLDQKLPFPSKSFEFVRMANLALCIPKDSWRHVLDEVRRVLAPGGRLEIIDDQIQFPYAKLPAPDPVSKSKSVTSPDMNEDDDPEDFDGATLQGHESATETESTLVSDGSRPNSFDGKSSQMTESVTVRPSDTQGQSMLDFLPETPTHMPSHDAQFIEQKRYVPLPTVSYTPQERRLTLQRQAHASRDLERVFRLMLRRQYGISYRPADRIVKYLHGIFGEESAGKKFSYHIKLAPADSPIGSTPEFEVTEKEEAMSIRGMPSPQFALDPAQGKKKAWMSVDREKQKRKKDDMLGDVDATSPAQSERTSTDSTLLITPSPVPASMNAKAAARLGLTLPSTPIGAASGKGTTRPVLKLSSDLSTLGNERLPFNRRDSVLSTSPVVTSFATSPDTPMATMTPKAAERLGFFYGRDGKDTRKKLNKPQQSPGLLIWPSTYIPMASSELEMHACKNIHTLLGCRAALADFIASQKDEQGKRLIDDEEFDSLIWDYECFRRSRLNWPSNGLDPYDDDYNNNNASTPQSFEAIPLKQSKSSGSSPSTPVVDLSDKFNGQYRRDDLTHVRTIRVFHAVKSLQGTILGMFRSKSTMDESQ